MTDLVMGGRYKLRRIPVEVRPSGIPEAAFELIAVGRWARWYVLPGGEIVTSGAGRIRGRAVLVRTGMTTADLQPAPAEGGPGSG